MPPDTYSTATYFEGATDWYHEPSIMSSFVIPVFADSMNEYVGSSTSPIILADFDSETTPDTESEPSEAPLSPDYVPASPDYVLASPDYFPESDLEEPPEEDPSEDDPFGDDVSERVELKVQAAPTPPAPLQIVRAVPILPRQTTNVVLPGHEIPFGRPYRTHPNRMHMLLTARKRVRPPVD
ncbi:hypothetical protein Tco_0016514 [Tanacetum coccineum]